jgi:hypothetical protein
MRSSPFYKHRKAGHYPLQIDGFLLLRRKNILPRIFFPHFDDESPANTENWFRTLLMLFCPYRNESALMGPFTSYEEKFYSIFNENCDPARYADVILLL